MEHRLVVLAIALAMSASASERLVVAATPKPMRSLAGSEVNRAEVVSYLEYVCSYIPSDDLDSGDISPTPDEAISKYSIDTNYVAGCLREIIGKYGIAETNEEARFARCGAVSWLGDYGATNDLQLLKTILTNGADTARQDAICAGLLLLKHSPDLIAFSREIITNEVSYSDRIRSWVAVCLADGCRPSLPDCYIDDAVQRGRIATFFLERAGAPAADSLLIDRLTCKLNPWYRHSQQRRDNLAALRPPGLTGKPAELYDARQRDAAQED